MFRIGLIICKKYAYFLNAFLRISYNEAKNNFLIRLARKWRKCFLLQCSKMELLVNHILSNFYKLSVSLEMEN